MEHRFLVTYRNTVLQEAEKTWPILNRPTFKEIMYFFRKCKDKQFFFFLCTQHFDGRCVCNRTVQQCGNPSLTTFVGYDKLLFQGRNGEMIQGKQEWLEKETCPNATLSAINPTRNRVKSDQALVTVWAMGRTPWRGFWKEEAEDNVVIIPLIKSWTRTTDQSARPHISGDFNTQSVRSNEQSTQSLLSYWAD